ncbi:hypothetical protein L1887_08366 [Cichorium endivia]|nr:hypothetical protein L1887_08366 [Cichorium endivia]
MPEPDIVKASSQPLATGTQQQSYKCLLNQQSQKLYKQLPVYQSYNEGSEHQPQFRTTVWVNNVSYTSPNTFQHRKLAESDAAKITLFAIKQKLKTEASHHIHEDKTFCKSILVEYAVRMNLQRPTYQTTQLGSMIPFFRSSLVFNDVTYTGDDCRTKKEAEQSAARAVLLKYLDSETENILPEIIKSKFHHQTVKKEIQSVENDTNAVNGPTLVSDEMTKMPLTSAPIEALVQHTTTPQTNTPEIQIPPTIPISTVLASETNNAPNYSTPMNPPMQVTQTHVPPIVTQTTPQTHVPPIVSQTTPVNVSATHPSYVVQQVTTTTTTPVTHIIPQISTQTITPTPTVLSQTPISDTNNPVPILAALPTSNNVTVTSGKKRNRKNRKNAQKKMRIENQLAMSGMNNCVFVRMMDKI